MNSQALLAQFAGRIRVLGEEFPIGMEQKSREVDPLRRVRIGPDGIARNF